MGTPNTHITNGQAGGRYWTGTVAKALTSARNLKGANAIQILTDAKFNVLTGNLDDVANVVSGSAPTIPAGTMLYGLFTGFTLHSGSVIYYRAA